MATVLAVTGTAPPKLRGHQRAVLEAISSSQGDVVYIANTGPSKRVAFVSPVAVSRTSVTIKVVLLQALQQEIVRRFRSARVSVRI